MSKLLKALAWIAALYGLGFIIVIFAVASGSKGDDSLSQHYKGVIQKVLVATDKTGHYENKKINN